jgi:hypothetical protein
MAKAKARERFGVTPEGQQIRCNSGADGIVRMKENGLRGIRNRSNGAISPEKAMRAMPEWLTRHGVPPDPFLGRPYLIADPRNSLRELVTERIHR